MEICDFDRLFAQFFLKFHKNGDNRKVKSLVSPTVGVIHTKADY